MARWCVMLFLVLSGAVVVRMDAAPMVQLDVWTDTPVALHTISPDPAPLTAALARLPAFEPHRIPGSAQAAGNHSGTVLSAVSVTQLSADRMRIRLASDDADAGHAIIDAVREGYVAAGLPERLRLASTTSGGPLVAIAQAVGALAALALLCEGFAAWARHRRRRHRHRRDHGRGHERRSPSLSARETLSTCEGTGTGAGVSATGAGFAST